MLEFRKKTYFRKILFSRPVFLLLLVVVVYFGISVSGVYRKSRNAVLRNEALETKIREMNERNETLEANLTQLRTESGIEKELRSKFQIKKPDEEFVVIVDDLENVEFGEKQKEKTDQELELGKNSLFQKLWNLVRF